VAPVPIFVWIFKAEGLFISVASAPKVAAGIDLKPGPLGVMLRSALTHAHAALHGKIERRFSPPHRRLDARVIAV
jgi:hypothetical protein